MGEFAERRRASGPNSAETTDERSVHGRSSTGAGNNMILGAASDRHEREADAVAEHVGRLLSDEAAGRVRPATPDTVVRAPSGPSPAGRVQRMSGPGAGGGAVDDDTDRRVRGAIGGGRPLPDEMRSQAESAFGADFGHVRVHDDARATELNGRIQAKAFTTGRDIFFRDGLPDHTTASGRHLLAHELTHTIQQTGAGRATIQRFLDPDQTKRLESERRRLTALLQTPRGKGKAAKARKEKIEELRSTISGLEELDRVTPEPVPAPTATDPAKQDELDRKVARLAELEGQNPDELDAKQAKKREQGIARLNRGIAALTAPAPTTDETSGESEQQATTTATSQPESTDATVSTSTDRAETATETAPETPGPDLAVESLRTTAADLAELEGKEVPPPKTKARQRHNRKVRDLKAKVAELEAAIQAAHPELSKLVGNAHAQELSNAFGEAGVTALRQVIPDSSLPTVCDKVGASALKSFVDLYGATTFWARLQNWGPAGTERLLEKLSPTKVRELDLAIGPARFHELVVRWRLSGDAFEHYPAAFLKNFPGADDRTWEHLVTIKYSEYSGAISGGHDEDVFYDFVDSENKDQQRISIDSTRSVGSDTKVVYTIYDDQGRAVQTGSKTLISGLTGKKAAMLRDVNIALWHAISKCEFDPDSNAWSATTPDGTSFSGFYRNGRIESFFPD